MNEYVIPVSDGGKKDRPYILPAGSSTALQALLLAFEYKGVKVINGDEVLERSALGTPVFMPLTFDQIIYKAESGEGKMDRLNMDIVIVEITGTKNIIKTPVAGSRLNGTVKEYINHGDFVVSIKGMFVGDDGRYPKEKVHDLMVYLMANVDIGVTHPLLNRMGINYLVIEKYSLPTKQGYQNVQLFELECLSNDIDAKLEFKSVTELK